MYKWRIINRINRLSSASNHHTSISVMMIRSHQMLPHPLTVRHDESRLPMIPSARSSNCDIQQKTSEYRGSEVRNYHCSTIGDCDGTVPHSSFCLYAAKARRRDFLPGPWVA